MTHLLQYILYSITYICYSINNYYITTNNKCVLNIGSFTPLIIQLQ